MDISSQAVEERWRPFHQWPVIVACLLLLLSVAHSRLCYHDHFSDFLVETLLFFGLFFFFTEDDRS